MKRHPSRAALRQFESADRTRSVDGRVSRHLAACYRCQEAVRRIRSVRSGAAELFDPPPPADRWAAIRAQLDAGDAVLLPVAGAPPMSRSPGIRRVAALFLLLSAGAVAAMAGPAILEWAVAVVDGTPPADTAAEAGIAATPQGSEVLVKLVGNMSAVSVRVRPSKSGLLEVTGRGAAAGAEFVLAGETVEIVGAEGGEVLLLVPEGITARLTTARSTVVLADSADVVVPPAGMRP